MSKRDIFQLNCAKSDRIVNFFISIAPIVSLHSARKRTRFDATALFPAQFLQAQTPMVEVHTNH